VLGDAQASKKATQVRLGREVVRVDERRLRAIDRALAKIDEGTYGLSDMSGKPIPKASLEATPEAVLTVEEEEQREKQQRR